MRALWLSLLFGVVVLAQTPAQPFPHHEMPPHGWYCSPADTPERVATDPHACACQGMIDEPVCSTMQQDEEDGSPVGEPHEVPLSNDNAKCKVFCHKDHCTCAVQCKGS